MQGRIAPTDCDWFQHLARETYWDEVNFWKPSATRGFGAAPGTPFFFKLKSPYNAIAGFGQVARFDRLPELLAWDCFGEANGAGSYAGMRRQIQRIRDRNKIQDAGGVPQIGCILLRHAVFFPREQWIRQPADWPARNLIDKIYDLSHGEGQRIWRACLENAIELGVSPDLADGEADGPRFGTLQLVAPRLGQGTFRVAVTEAYDRACAVTREHSLPALDAAHIKPFVERGPHEIPNGLLLRADLHRLFDKGYLTVTPDRRIEVSPRLRTEYENGHTYYPHHGRRITLPADPLMHPNPNFLRWHNENVYLGG